MLLAVIGAFDRAAKRNAVHREGGNVADTSEAFRLADVNVDDGLARGNGVGDIGRAVLKDRGERDIFALIFHTEHFHQGEVQPACRTGKHGTDVFARKLFPRSDRGKRCCGDYLYLAMIKNFPTPLEFSVRVGIFILYSSLL